ncbi:MAG: sigma-54-dependent Fis family transcriptional regulator [Candidatus Aureabacteria bacterium]|nr:sigma-54-dependent Fis family transcriptional regulator [Candidatus Auribacterota bacterium]
MEDHIGLAHSMFRSFIALTGARCGMLLLRAGSGGEWRIAAEDGMPKDRSGDVSADFCAEVISRAGRIGSAVAGCDTARRVEPMLYEGGIGGRQRGFMLCVPLRVGERLVGVIYADGEGRPLSPEAPASAGQDQLPFTALTNGAESDQVRWGTREILGSTDAIHGVRRLVEKAARGSSTILIEGETGTGKELVAQAIHSRSARHRKIFLAQNCAAMPDGLLESELFGHCRGAFTGALAERRGLFEVANGGTVFLDEIADCTPAMQAKLLRVLESGVIRPIGGTRELKIDMRVIVATNRTLEDEVRRGRFRRDLYYRLSVFPIRMPALRERPEDIPLLAKHFLATHAGRMRRGIRGFTAGAMEVLKSYEFKGNVRELENEIERLVAMHEGGGMIEAGELSRKITCRPLKPGHRGGEAPLREALREFEREFIKANLDSCGGNKTRAAKRLGISRYGLYKKIGGRGGEPELLADGPEGHCVL